jgi:hypothetical protein
MITIRWIKIRNSASITWGRDAISPQRMSPLHRGNPESLLRREVDRPCPSDAMTSSTHLYNLELSSIIIPSFLHCLFFFILASFLSFCFCFLLHQSFSSFFLDLFPNYSFFPFITCYFSPSLSSPLPLFFPLIYLLFLYFFNIFGILSFILEI